MWVLEVATAGGIVCGKAQSQITINSLEDEQKQTVEKLKKETKARRRLLKSRQHHKFKQGRVLYIISDGDNNEEKYKPGITDDANERFKTHRSTMRQPKLEYLMYIDNNKLLEDILKSHYFYDRGDHANHEWIEGVKLKEIIQYVEAMATSVCHEFTLADESDINKYNADLMA
jgi:hypothetical protein